MVNSAVSSTTISVELSAGEVLLGIIDDDLADVEVGLVVVG